MCNVYKIQNMTGHRRKCNLPFYFINVQYFVQFWLPLSATYMLILGELLGVGLLANLLFHPFPMMEAHAELLRQSGNAAKTLLCIVVMLIISCLTFVDPCVEIDPSVLCINLVTWLKTHA